MVQASELHGVEVVDRLLYAELQKQENLRRLQHEQLQRELQECSFTPKIDPNSQQLA